MLRTCGIEFARRAFFVVAPIANPTKTNPIQRSREVAKRRKTPAAGIGPDRRRRTRATTTPGSATTRSIGSRRSGRASKSPMYRASRILDFNRSPHDFDERVFEAGRFERDLALLAQASLDDREDFFGGAGFEHLRRSRSVSCRRLDDDAHANPRVSLRLLHRPEECRPSLCHDGQVVREDFRFVEVMR